MFPRHVRMASLRNTLVSAIACLEIEVRCPVVAEILTELAGSAGSNIGDITGGHRSIEGVSSHNLVNVWRGDQARVDKGVEPVNNDIRASEPQHREAATRSAELGRRFGEGREGEESSPMHPNRTF